MSVVSYEEGDLFVIRVSKALVSNPENEWANGYEFQATTGTGEGDLLTLAEALVEFEQNLHRTTVEFRRALISTWSPDSVPYNPEAFISSTLTANGLLVVSGELVALNICLSVARTAATGRVGHLFYRGALEEAQVSAPAGKSILSSRPAWQLVVNNALTASGLDDYIGASPAGAFRLVMVSADGSQIRPVIALTAQGVATVKTDHAWFNRTTPTP
jgi:hypothetical protein